MSSLPFQDAPHPWGVRVGAVVTVLASLVGLVTSARLTWAKFQIDYRCDASGCLGGGSGWSCEEALTSPWSIFLELPWSLWSAAHAVVAATFAWMLLARRGPLAHAAPRGLLVLAVLAVGASAALAGHALTMFRHLCFYCVLLYCVSGLWLVGAGLIAVGLRRRSVGPGARVIGGLKAASLYVGIMGLQSAAYGLASQQAQCPAPLVPPPTSLRMGTPEPRAIVLLFVDPSCSVCRSEFHLLAQSRERLQRHGADLWVHMYPRMICDGSGIEPEEFVDAGGREQTAQDARLNNACLGALAALCAEQVAPGRMLETLDRIFDLQDTAGPYFTLEKVTGRIDPAAGGAFHRCMTDPAKLAEIVEHQRYFLAWSQRRGGRLGVPYAWVITVEDGRLNLSDAVQASSVAKIFRVLER